MVELPGELGQAIGAGGLEELSDLFGGILGGHGVGAGWEVEGEYDWDVDGSGIGIGMKSYVVGRGSGGYGRRRLL